MTRSRPAPKAWQAAAAHAARRAPAERPNAAAAELRDYVDGHVLRRSPRPVIVAAIAIVFTRTWPLRDRVRLAWAIVK